MKNHAALKLVSSQSSESLNHFRWDVVSVRWVTFLCLPCPSMWESFFRSWLVATGNKTECQKISIVRETDQPVHQRRRAS